MRNTSLFIFILALITLLNLLPGSGVQARDLTKALKIKSVVIDSKFTRVKKVSTYLELAYIKDLISYLKLDTELGAKFDTGASEMSLSDEFASKSELFVTNAALKYHSSAKNLATSVSAGALDQSRNELGIILTDHSLPALEEEFSYGKSNIFALSATQAIATNNNYTSKIAELDEGSPGLLVESLYYLTGNSKVQLSHFKFFSLSSSLAYQYRLWGNEVLGTNKLNSKFKNEFEGIILNASLDGAIWGAAHELRVDFIKNLRADDESTGLMLAYTLNKELNYALGVKLFWLEADIAPAIYTDKTMGHTNTMGGNMYIEQKFARGEESNFNLRLGFTHSRPIRQNLFKTKMNYFYLTLTHNL